MSLSIGKTIKKLRKERNLTQEELAELLNVTAQAVSNGKTKPECRTFPRFSLLQACLA